MESVVVVDVSKLDESVGVKVAVNETEPRAPGVHEHVADIDAAAADAHPEIVDPPNWKLTDPARGTVAVMMTAPPSAALVELLGSAIEIDVEALLTVMVSDRLPTCELVSVALTVCEYVPAASVLEAVTTVPESVIPLITEPSDQV
jgi:hypothetical protein